MGNFSQHQGPLKMLKIKMELKAAKDPAYKKFETELALVTAEANKFMEALEYEVATAEGIDGAEASLINYT